MASTIISTPSDASQIIHTNSEPETNPSNSSVVVSSPWAAIAPLEPVQVVCPAHWRSPLSFVKNTPNASPTSKVVSPRSMNADPSITMVWFVPVIYTSHGAASIKIQSPLTHSYPSAQSTAAQGSISPQEATKSTVPW